MNRSVLSLVASMLLFCAGAARAQSDSDAGSDAPPPRSQLGPEQSFGPRTSSGMYGVSPGSQQHDGGFFRMSGGVGSMGLETPVQGFAAKLSGTSYAYSFAGGTALADSFLVGGELWGLYLSSPKVEYRGKSGTASDTSIRLTGVGLSLTYYVMPWNAYVTVVPSLASAKVSAGDTTGTSDDGFGIRLAVGKEWWVSDDWGVGLSFQYAHASNGDGGGGTVTTNWYGVALSATYN